MANLNDVLKDKERTYLWEECKAPLFDDKIDQLRPNVIPYIIENSKSCVVICPGGGYEHKAYHEGEPVALWLNSIGVSAFVVDYRTSPYRFPCPQLDAKRAIRYARANAEKYGYPSDKVGILGFSAGGHLAACCGTIFDDLGYEKQDEIDEFSARPDFMVLCYPVISFTDNAHLGSARNLLGEDAKTEEMKSLSLQTRVTSESSPAFIWHSFSDGVVSVNNSIMMAAALSANGVPNEIHTFFEGRHGVGLGEEFKSIGKWTDLCEGWMRDSGYLD